MAGAASSLHGLTEREAGAVTACRLIFERLRLVLEEETSALAARTMVSHAPFTERKNQLLRELLVAQRNCTSPPALAALKGPASGLKALLARNQRLLKVHIDAVKEVSAIIVDAIRQSDSDGTYSRHGHG